MLAMIRIQKSTMVSLLKTQHRFSEMFVAFLLSRNARYQEALADQLFNSSEKRLARVLLQLAKYGNGGVAEPVVPKMTHEMLAEMVGTTRARISFFMNRFRKMGFIHYNGVTGSAQLTAQCSAARLKSCKKRDADSSGISL